MDWQGQKLAEELMQNLLLVFGGVALIAGYATSSFRTMMLIYAGAMLLTTIITVPNWPFFNRHPLKWLRSNRSREVSETRTNSRDFEEDKELSIIRILHFGSLNVLISRHLFLHGTLSEVEVPICRRMYLAASHFSR